MSKKKKLRQILVVFSREDMEPLMSEIRRINQSDLPEPITLAHIWAWSMTQMIEVINTDAPFNIDISNTIRDDIEDTIADHYADLEQVELFRKLADDLKYVVGVLSDIQATGGFDHVCRDLVASLDDYTFSAAYVTTAYFDRYALDLDLEEV